jgi:hypothetical protein
MAGEKEGKASKKSKAVRYKNTRMYQTLLYVVCVCVCVCVVCV